MSPLSYVRLMGLVRFPLDFARDSATCLFNNGFVNLLCNRGGALLCVMVRRFPGFVLRQQRVRRIKWKISGDCRAVEIVWGASCLWVCF